MREIFQLLLRIEQKCGVRLLIIGGWALQAHGYSRQTVDVDCLISAEDDAALGSMLAEAGFECFDDTVAFRRFRHRVNVFMVLDVLRVDAATFAKFWTASADVVVDGMSWRVPSLSHLIALKLHVSKNEHRVEKDVDDVLQLLAANPAAIPPDELRALCERFGPPGVAERFRRFL